MELISAIATAQGVGGIAVIRVSGEGALPLARKMFSYKGEFEPYRLYPGHIDCGAFSDRGMVRLLSRAALLHGGGYRRISLSRRVEIARAVYQRTLDLGARPAEAGEFTRRAFLNGKLSLSAAEGLG